MIIAIIKYSLIAFAIILLFSYIIYSIFASEISYTDYMYDKKLIYGFFYITTMVSMVLTFHLKMTDIIFPVK